MEAATARPAVRPSITVLALAGGLFVESLIVATGGPAGAALATAGAIAGGSKAAILIRFGRLAERIERMPL